MPTPVSRVIQKGVQEAPAGVRGRSGMGVHSEPCRKGEGGKCSVQLAATTPEIALAPVMPKNSYPDPSIERDVDRTRARPAFLLHRIDQNRPKCSSEWPVRCCPEPPRSPCVTRRASAKRGPSAVLVPEPERCVQEDPSRYRFRAWSEMVPIECLILLRLVKRHGPACDASSVKKRNSPV